MPRGVRKNIHTIPFHIGDWTSGTSDLTTLETGAYIRLLVKNYANGASGLPDDDRRLATIAGLTLDKWKKICPAVKAKFESRSGKLHSARALQVMENISGKSFSIDGNLLNNNKSHHQPDIKPTKQPESIIHNPESNIPPTPQGGNKEDDFFNQLVLAFPHKHPFRPESARSSFDEALDAGTVAEDIIIGAKNYSDSDKVKDGYIMGFTKWLDQEGWKIEKSENETSKDIIWTDEMLKLKNTGLEQQIIINWFSHAKHVGDKLIMESKMGVEWVENRYDVWIRKAFGGVKIIYESAT